MAKRITGRVQMNKAERVKKNGFVVFVFGRSKGKEDGDLRCSGMTTVGQTYENQLNPTPVAHISHSRWPRDRNSWMVAQRVD